MLFGGSDNEYLVGSLLLDSLGESVAAGAFALDKPIEELNELSESLNGVGSGVVDSFAVLFLRQIVVVFFNSLNFCYFSFA